MSQITSPSRQSLPRLHSECWNAPNHEDSIVFPCSSPKTLTMCDLANAHCCKSWKADFEVHTVRSIAFQRLASGSKPDCRNPSALMILCPFLRAADNRLRWSAWLLASSRWLVKGSGGSLRLGHIALQLTHSMPLALHLIQFAWRKNGRDTASSRGSAWIMAMPVMVSVRKAVPTS